jgi:hypothetical protein
MAVWAAQSRHSMQYTIQFVRFRRELPEVIRTSQYDAVDPQAALEQAKADRLPPRADGLRVLDERGRCVHQWRVGQE